MSNEERPQRGQAFIDRDMMNTLMAMGFPIGKSAELVGKLFYERGERGVHTVVYGDLRSEVGEAHLRNFVRLILTTYPSAYERELHALAMEGKAVKPADLPSARPQMSDEQLSRMRDRVNL